MKLVVGNWKANLTSRREAVRLALASDFKNIVLCPPAPYLIPVRARIKKASLGAQDTFWEAQGPYTGQISPKALYELGVRYVIIGHSEKRRLGETDEAVNKKLKAALRAKLIPILCVGEPKEVRKKGFKTAERFVANQLKKDLHSLNTSAKGGSASGGKSYILNAKLIVAYEPIWAIGTGTPDDPKQSARMASLIKQFLHTTYNILHTKVLYGGSVTSKNIARIISHKEIDGVLVGGASIKVEEFRKIVKIT